MKFLRMKTRELQEALAEPIVEVEIINRNVRVAALQKRWDGLSKAFDELLDHCRHHHKNRTAPSKPVGHRQERGRPGPAP
jgi:hypothetical protein